MKEIGSQPLDMTELRGFMGMSREKRLAIEHFGLNMESAVFNPSLQRSRAARASEVEDGLDCDWRDGLHGR